MRPNPDPSTGPLLPDKWAGYLDSQAETGMGYQVVSLRTTDGQRFDRVVVMDHRIAMIDGRSNVVFDPARIAELWVTHEQWDGSTTSDIHAP